MTLTQLVSHLVTFHVMELLLQRCLARRTSHLVFVHILQVAPGCRLRRLRYDR